MSGYNYNLYTGGAIPDQGVNGLPIVLAGANLPTQGVSSPPSGTQLDYSPYVVESQYQTPATTLPKGETRQSFEPTPQPKAPSIWRSVYNAVIHGGVKTGTNYAAKEDYTANGAGVGINANTLGGGVGGHVTTGQTSITRQNSL